MPQNVVFPVADFDVRLWPPLQSWWWEIISRTQQLTTCLLPGDGVKRDNAGCLRAPSFSGRGWHSSYRGPLPRVHRPTYWQLSFVAPIRGASLTFGGSSSPVSRDGVRHRRGRRARAPLGREGVDAALGGRRASPQTKTRRRNSERPDKRTKSRRPAVHKLSPIVGLLSRSRLVEHVPFGRVSYLGRLCEITLYTAGVRGGGRSPKRVRPSIRCYSRYLRVTGL